MQVALRSRLNVGIALAGAGALALAPIAQPMPAIAELQARTVSSAGVALTAGVTPIEQWSQITKDAFTNGGALLQSYLNNPAPILRQMTLNALGNGEQALAAAQTSFTSLVDHLRSDNPYGLPMAIETGLSQIFAGQIYEGVNALWAGGVGLIVNPLFPLVELLQIPTAIVQNVANVVAEIPSIALGLGLAAIGSINGPLLATAHQVQVAADAFRTGDLLGAVGAVVAIPGAIVDAALNGFAPSGTPGLLSPFGIIDQLIGALDRIAKAIAPATSTPFATTEAGNTPSALPSAAVSVEPVTLGAAKPEATESTATVPALTNPTAAEPAADEPTPGQPAADEPTATEPLATEPLANEPNGDEPTATEPLATEPTADEPTADEPTAAEPETPSTATETAATEKLIATLESGTASASASAGRTTPDGGGDTTNGNKEQPDNQGQPTKSSGSIGSEAGSSGTSSGNSASDSGSDASGDGASGAAA